MIASTGLLALAKSGEAAKAGPIGLGVILLLCIACYFLFKSMSKHMRNVRENFPAETSSGRPSRTSAAPHPVTTPPSTPSATPPPAGDGGTAGTGEAPASPD